MNQMYDVAVVGAGSAGLQAALTLGRMNRPVAVLGTDRYRNDPAAEMHNFIGHDGAPPAELRTAARADLGRYDSVEMIEAEVTGIESSADVFTLDVTGVGVVTARRIILAMGVADTLPDVPGLAGLWGDLVAHCPYCHGHEFSGRPVGLLGADASLPLRAALLERIASSRVVLTDGVELDPDVADALKRMEVEVRTEPVAGVSRGALGVDVALEGAGPVALGGLFVHTAWAPTAPFAEQLGLDRSPVGAIVVDGFGRTSRRGVYAAGDVAQPAGLPMPMSSVLVAAAGGQVAAAACDRELAAADNGIALPLQAAKAGLRVAGWTEQQAMRLLSSRLAAPGNAAPELEGPKPSATLDQKMRSLLDRALDQSTGGGQSESILRPVFKDDEPLMISVGAVLGGIVGEIQVQVIERFAH